MDDEMMAETPEHLSDAQDVQQVKQAASPQPTAGSDAEKGSSGRQRRRENKEPASQQSSGKPDAVAGMSGHSIVMSGLSSLILSCQDGVDQCTLSAVSKAQRKILLCFSEVLGLSQLLFFICQDSMQQGTMSAASRFGRGTLAARTGGSLIRTLNVCCCNFSFA